jgi:uncharacterized alkaline shock family protein YloU
MTAATVPSRIPRTGHQDLPGRTTLADRAVERAASQAITEIADVGGTARWVLGEPAEERHAQVNATVDDSTASLHVRLSIAYPASVAQTTQRVRSHLVQRLHELTGLAVTRVDITVTALYLTHTGHRRVR